ncbi:MAG: hypothetical protein LUG18_09285 [Candidatus Azobacteroides sp.]|nr:hypothetical protein [Candidatus Azobacteroides sp.]
MRNDMMDYSYFVLFSLPAFSALVCLCMFLCSDKGFTARKDRQVYISLIGYFISVFINWITVALLFYFNEWQVWLYPLRYTSLLLFQVFFYRFIFMITRLPKDKPFSAWHYIVPVILGLFFVIYFLVTPGWVLEAAFGSYIRPVEGKAVFNELIFSNFKIRLLYDIIYITLIIKRIGRYRQEIGNYASQLQQSYQGWLNALIVLSVVMISGPAIVAFSTDRMYMASHWLFLPVILLLIQHVLIIYNTLIHNFIIPEEVPEDVSFLSGNGNEQTTSFKTLNKNEFERFLAEKRPFTNHHLKITDLANSLHTNRTYLSEFINTVYGMNFSTLINERRLIYLDELRKDPAIKEKTNLELIYMAGFGSYQSYVRAKEKEKERTTLKV